jgi:hypothetical protein
MQDCHTYSGYLKVDVTSKSNLLWTTYTALVTETEALDGQEHVSTYKVRNTIPPIPDH